MLNGLIIPKSFLETQVVQSTGVRISGLVALLVLPSGGRKTLAVQNPCTHCRAGSGALEAL